MTTGPHQRQKHKNYAVMGAILAFVAVIFLVTIVRLKGG